MPKSLKKSTALNEKPQITRKSAKGTVKSEMHNKTETKTKTKTIKKLARKSEKSTGDSKQSMVLALLRRPSGATIDEMAKATNWQRHSVQGMMSGVLKKKLGLTITSDKEERGRVYRITGSVSRL